ncbi:2Fe-2S iron-sulfur cluster-binding protein, partial [Actinoallomurus sp. NPDC050550]|uniref:2Fe-2S iron-sulfur cluster-binding protein n=1 Tax=Actinoallomurus sp. NPDC050550 TaxID=3154937 RepID=UPI0033E97480
VGLGGFALWAGSLGGFGTAGHILGGAPHLTAAHARSDEEIREAMSGNICRCGAYPGIVDAIKKAREAG